MALYWHGMRPIFPFTIGAALCVSSPVAAAPATALLIEPVAEKVVQRLPPGALHWRIERYPTLAPAKAAAGPWSLAAAAWGQAWLVTLSGKGGASPGGRKVAEIGPVATPREADRFLLRVNLASGPPGAKTPVHAHPGSEAFFVLRGELTQRTQHGLRRVPAGEVMAGHEPGTIMQLHSTGAEPLRQLVMFVVDADKPFSTPGEFETP